MKAQFKRSKGFSTIKPKMGGGKAPSLSDAVDVWDWGKKAAWKTGRFVGPIHSIGIHTLTIQAKDGKKQFTKTCLAYNSETESRDSTKKCPYCTMGAQSTFKIKYFSNIIDRALQEDEPKKKTATPAEKKSGFKSSDSESWTPARVIGMPPSLATRVQETVSYTHLTLPTKRIV